jgi:hypothetical protein
MITYPANFTITSIDNVKGRILNGKTGLTPINISVDQVNAGDHILGKIIVDEFQDQNDPTRMVVMFKLMVEKVSKGKKQPKAESF